MLYYNDFATSNSNFGKSQLNTKYQDRERKLKLT